MSVERRSVLKRDGWGPYGLRWNLDRRKSRMRVRTFFAGAVAALACLATLNGGAIAALADSSASPSRPNFGSSVYIFNPGMPQSQIQATVDAISAQQLDNEFGTQRYALLFEPGVYGSSAVPLSFKVGYYTAVAGLGLSPDDVVI